MSEQDVLFRSNHSFTTVKIAITYSKCIYSVFLYDPSVEKGTSNQTVRFVLCEFDSKPTHQV